jgi:hypothetical protein
LRERNPWLAVACDAARREGAWHWDLEFAPAFAKGGFDLQVGNPPWVRPIWEDDLVLAEYDPWWGVTDKAVDQGAQGAPGRELLLTLGLSGSYLTRWHPQRGRSN